MNKQKQTYLSPETETLVVRFEGCVCQSPGVTITNTTRGGYRDEDEIELS